MKKGRKIIARLLMGVMIMSLFAPEMKVEAGEYLQPKDGYRIEYCTPASTANEADLANCTNRMSYKCMHLWQSEVICRNDGQDIVIPYNKVFNWWGYDTSTAEGQSQAELRLKWTQAYDSAWNTLNKDARFYKMHIVFGTECPYYSQQQGMYAPTIFWRWLGNTVDDEYHNLRLKTEGYAGAYNNFDAESGNGWNNPMGIAWGWNGERWNAYCSGTQYKNESWTMTLRRMDMSFLMREFGSCNSDYMHKQYKLNNTDTQYTFCRDWGHPNTLHTCGRYYGEDYYYFNWDTRTWVWVDANGDFRNPIDWYESYGFTLPESAVYSHNTYLCGGHYIPLHTHDYRSEVTTQPWCTTTGVRTYTCYGTAGTCSKPTYTETIPALNHAESPTYTYDANNHWKICTRCKETIVAAKAHTYGSVIVDKKETCTTDGQTHKVCSACGYTPYTTVPALGHKDPGVYSHTVGNNQKLDEKYKLCTDCGTKVESWMAQSVTVNAEDSNGVKQNISNAYEYVLYFKIDCKR